MTSSIILSICAIFFFSKFENKWEWESPPTSGGVYRDNVEVFFCKGDQGNSSTWLSIVVDNVDEYYELIKESGAKIL